MKIIESILTKNPCYKAGRKITVKGLMIHSVGTPQPSAQVFVKNWNSASHNNSCVHAFIDANTGDVYQTLPWNHRGWHGGGSSNNTHIGVEMCEPSTIKYTSGANWTDKDPAKTKEAVMRTYQSAVELFAMLCKMYNLDPMKNIVSHKEGHTLGIASGHADPEHLWSKFGLTMEGFRKAVQAQMASGDGITPTTTQKPVTANPVQSYKVRITADVLNIRSGAGTKYKVVGQIKDKGVYTIEQDQNGWGKLKSGAGWISLAYTKKV